MSASAGRSASSVRPSPTAARNASVPAQHRPAAVRLYSSEPVRISVRSPSARRILLTGTLMLPPASAGRRPGQSASPITSLGTSAPRRSVSSRSSCWARRPPNPRSGSSSAPCSTAHRPSSRLLMAATVAGATVASRAFPVLPAARVAASAGKAPVGSAPSVMTLTVPPGEWAGRVLQQRRVCGLGGARARLLGPPGSRPGESWRQGNPADGAWRAWQRPGQEPRHPSRPDPGMRRHPGHGRAEPPVGVGFAPAGCHKDRWRRPWASSFSGKSSLPSCNGRHACGSAAVRPPVRGRPRLSAVFN